MSGGHLKSQLQLSCHQFDTNWLAVSKLRKQNEGFMSISFLSLTDRPTDKIWPSSSSCIVKAVGISKAKITCNCHVDRSWIVSTLIEMYYCVTQAPLRMEVWHSCQSKKPFLFLMKSTISKAYVRLNLMEMGSPVMIDATNCHLMGQYKKCYHPAQWEIWHVCW